MTSYRSTSYGSRAIARDAYDVLAGRARTGSPGRAPAPGAEPTWGRAPWFEQWEAEHRTVREGVGLMDMSFMAKFRVQGADAGDVLDRVSPDPVNEKSETITYTQWLDEDGRIEGDLTVTKLGEGDFLVVASDTAHGHALAWLGRPRRRRRLHGHRRHRRLRPAQRPGAPVT